MHSNYSIQPTAAPAPALGIRGFHPPAQGRSLATLDRIVRATEAVLAERGPSGVTVGRVVRRARASVGSFYARFDDKDAAIRYAQQRFWGSLEVAWDQYLDPSRWTEVSPIGVVAGLIRTLVRVQVRDARRLRAFMTDALERPRSGLIERTVALDRHVARGVAALLAARGPSLSGPAARETAALGFERVLSAVRDQVMLGRLAGPGGAAPANQLTLVLVGMYAGLLGLADAPRTYADLLRLCARGRS
jgi:AcrR family transcriptional regulator